MSVASIGGLVQGEPLTREQRIRSAICPFTGLAGGDDQKPVEASRLLDAHAQAVAQQVVDLAKEKRSCVQTA